MSRYYVTTPIYYVNDRPHIGHAYTTILADVLRRFNQLMGHETYFLTGVDEHGQKVQDAAASRDMTPQAHCDDMHLHFKNLWPTLGVEPNDFIRTTESRHKRVVAQALQELFDKGDIYEREYEGWYSPSVERYWTEKDLVDGRCPESGAEVVFLKEKNYFFRMSKYKGALLAHMDANPDWIRPKNRRNEVLGFLENDLRDLCISRPKARLSWGIELPFDADYVTYVWFDALLNYVTGVGLYSDDDAFQKWWPESMHILGKDILTTHCVYWPTFLLALGLPLPKGFLAHGWWLMGDRKMSKSLGNVVDPFELVERYGHETLRYFLMRDMSFSQDATFTLDVFIARNNGDLANDLGNLLSRATKLLRKAEFGMVVPKPGPVLPEDEGVIAGFKTLPGRIAARIDTLEINRALEDILQEVRGLNKYIADTRPFQVVKEDVPRAGAIMYNILEGLRFSGVLLSAVMPEKAARIVSDVGWDEAMPTISNLTWGALKAGNAVTAGSSLFERIEAPKEEAPQEEAPKGKETSSLAASKPGAKEEGKGKPMIEYDDFAKLDMVVGVVTSAERVEKAAKLLCVMVDIGSETRQVVAGIAKHYEPEALVGKKVVLLKNLKPRKLFGLESQGMILAAESENGALTVITPGDTVEPGAEVA